MLCINISYKVPAAKVAEVEEPLIAHGKHMDHVYPSGNPDGVNPAEAYFTKSEEFNDPTDPSKGKTGNIIFTVNEKWHKPEHIQNHIEKAKAAGIRVKTGIEAEFFLLTPDGSELSDEYDTAAKPCYDQQAVMRRYDIIAEICDYMLKLGWAPYQNDHEDANGQFEMNFEFDDALKTADKHSFFKFMTKSIAEKHGMRATFMPKPVEGLTGNGCHAHISVWDESGTIKAFEDDKNELGLSDKGYNFLGGIMKHATAMAAITNPTVNSYKRINAPRTTSGATWAPNTVTWTGNNRTHMVRVPGPGRFELRLPDGATNPYLLQAVIIAAGMHGLETNADLIVLSACNTSSKSNKYAAGFSGLINSFFAAGSKSVIATHWPVEDEAGYLLMSETMKKVINFNQSISVALQNTKIEFIKGKYGEKFKKPLFWAPYVYVGL